MTRKLVAAIACRNQGTRLYGKPMQNLDIISKTTILQYIINCLKTINEIDEIVLGISEGLENEVFKIVANQNKLNYIVGDQDDVLSRLIKCGEVSDATDIFRITSESPYLFFESVEALWEEYQKKNLDAIFMDEIIDGCGFEIISMNALIKSHKYGKDKHRSEFCSLFIRENLHMFNIIKKAPTLDLIRNDLRLTVDYPEDLVICRKIYEYFLEDTPRISLIKIVNFLDSNPELKKLVSPFTEIGYSTMNK
jgi:spore coat polysaccharide biosynthesis protein SpsF